MVEQLAHQLIRDCGVDIDKEASIEIDNLSDTHRQLRGQRVVPNINLTFGIQRLLGYVVEFHFSVYVRAIALFVGWLASGQENWLG